MSLEQKLLWLFGVLLSLGLVLEVFIWVKKLFFIITRSEVLCENNRTDV
jgi:hypothetical protein